MIQPSRFSHLQYLVSYPYLVRRHRVLCDSCFFFSLSLSLDACLVFFLFGLPLMPEICLTVQPPEPFPVPKLRLAGYCSLAIQALHQLLQQYVTLPVALTSVDTMVQARTSMRGRRVGEQSCCLCFWLLIYLPFDIKWKRFGLFYPSEWKFGFRFKKLKAMNRIRIWSDISVLQVQVLKLATKVPWKNKLRRGHCETGHGVFVERMWHFQAQKYCISCP